MKKYEVIFWNSRLNLILITSDAMACQFSDAATWVLVIAGWYVIHRATLSRERRKESRDAVSKSIDQIRSIEDLAIKFHTSENFNTESYESLIWQINRTIRSLQRPPLKELDLSKSLLSRFRREITLNNADASTFEQQDRGSIIVKDIRTTTDRLLDAIEAARDAKFV